MTDKSNPITDLKILGEILHDISVFEGGNPLVLPIPAMTTVIDMSAYGLGNVAVSLSALTLTFQQAPATPPAKS